jgi:serine/threonine protein kinase
MPAWRIGDWVEDRYQVFDIHAGGMGLVFVVYDHEGLPGQRVLALKTLKPKCFASSRAVARFVGECRTWVQLDRHPNIVRAQAVHLIGGQPFVFLELVTGGSLRSWIGTARLDLPQALRFGAQFCLGMEHAARKGLHCHRDIKPENLLITEGGTLKVTDFGLAKISDVRPTYGAAGDPIPIEGGDGLGLLAGDDDAPSSSPREVIRRDPFATLQPIATARGPGESGADGATSETGEWRPAVAPVKPSPSPLSARGGTDAIRGLPDAAMATQEGAMLGTGLYMAPEQFRDPRGVGLHADQYSFGVVLFEMIAGKTPFRRGSSERVARQHAIEPPPAIGRFIPARYARFVPRVERIVNRCLAKEPSQRYATFAELRLELSALLRKITGETIAVPTEIELEAWDLASKGVSLGSLGRFDEEGPAYEAALRVKLDWVPAWFNHAAAAGSLGRLVEALQFADMALHLNPRSVPALINKGLALHALKRPGDALRCLDEALHLAPRDPDAWRARVVVLVGQGHTAGAQAAAEQVRRLRPDHPALMPGSSVRATPGKLPWVRRTEDSAAS